MIIVLIVLILYFNGVFVSNSTQKVYVPNTVGKNVCFLTGLALKDNSSNNFRCDNKDDCLNSLTNFHEAMEIPLPSQSTLDKIECLPG